MQRRREARAPGRHAERRLAGAARQEVSTRTASARFMKTLFLVRHAKSSRDPPGLPDEDRPLAGRGERDAPKMGRRLAKLVAAKLHYKPKRIVVDRRLYPGRLEELLSMIEELDDELESVMLFGHNP